MLVVSALRVGGDVGLAAGLRRELLQELRVHREARAHVVRLAEEIDAVLHVDLVAVADLDRVDLARPTDWRGAPRIRERSIRRWSRRR